MPSAGRESEPTAVLGLGSNTGDRIAALREAARKIAEIPGVTLLGRSRVYETPPAGGPPQPDYLNAAVLIRTALAPVDILAKLLIVEQSMGRVRPDPVRWGPRTIDIDILWLSSGAVDEPGLTVPHPRLRERPFALRPLLDVIDLREYADLPAARALLRRIGDL